MLFACSSISSGKNWCNKISHVDILQSIKFGTNQKFEWAIPDVDTKNT